MKVALITIYDDYNIGNKLQNYALQEVLRDEGCEVDTIYMSSFGMWRLSWKGWLVMLAGIPRKASLYRRLMLKRKRRLGEFSSRYLKVSRPYTYEQVKGGALNDYDAIVCGSDQVWHHWTRDPEELDYFFLKFAERRKRICYAPSFGLDKVPEVDEEKYREGLMGFDRLSCRESSGCELIRRMTGREAELMCDPTMLLTTDEWDKIAAKPQARVPERYLLTYFIGQKSDETKRKIEEIAKEQGLEVVNIFDHEVTKGDKEYFTTGPEEFVYLVKHAGYVCTDSYHGTVFSILYRKSYTNFPREGADGRQMKGRLETLADVYVRGGENALIEARERGRKYIHEEIKRRS